MINIDVWDNYFFEKALPEFGLKAST